MSTSTLAATLLKPRSIAIVGASAEPHSPGGGVLANLDRFSFPGAIHLVNPNRTEIGARRCVPSIDDLPEGIDLAVLAIPQHATAAAVEACARRRIRSIMIFASGFAEVGGEGRTAQDRITAFARDHNMIIAGPNCLGYVNFVDGIPLTFGAVSPKPAEQRDALAILSQSGAMSSVLRFACTGRQLPVSYAISSGNEAGIGVEDYLEYVIDDNSTRLVAMYVEQFRRPKAFLDLIRRARAAGKPVVLLHPGRSDAARKSAESHTGAMTGDYQVMRTIAERAGALMVDTIEELIDVAELLFRYPPPKAGPGIITDSGAYKGLALDYCDSLGLELPAIEGPTATALRTVLPTFVEATNPLDLTAQAMRDGDLYRKTLEPLLADERFGSIVFGVILGTQEASLHRGRRILASIPKTQKPVLIAALGDDGPLAPEIVQEIRAAGLPFFRSPERALRMLAKVTQYGQTAAAHADQMASDVTSLPDRGTIPEFRAKQYLKAAGLSVPPGGLATNVSDAERIANGIGYPVAIKAQSSALSHKSDAGGVILNIADAKALQAAWTKMHETMSLRNGLVLDGVLVERMAEPGLEMILGAKRDPQWGAVVVAGLGGVWTEALDDFVVLPVDLSQDEIVAKLAELKAAKLLHGLRGHPKLDVESAARAIGTLCRFIQQHANVREADINPLVVYPEGKGVLALDGLIVISDALRATTD
ncbi:MAG: acetate--CoA ligase family protein [Pseudomonadota bacterium]